VRALSFILDIGPLPLHTEATWRGQGGSSGANEQMVEYSQITTTSYALTAEGEGIAKNGSHEYRVWKVLSPKGGEPKSVPDLQVR